LERQPTGSVVVQRTVPFGARAGRRGRASARGRCGGRRRWGRGWL